jgi:hypothetical protein
MLHALYLMYLIAIDFVPRPPPPRSEEGHCGQWIVSYCSSRSCRRLRPRRALWLRCGHSERCDQFLIVPEKVLDAFAVTAKWRGPVELIHGRVQGAVCLA